MTTQRAGDHSTVVRRRAVRRMVVRALLISVALVVLYYWLPLTGALDAPKSVALATRPEEGGAYQRFLQRRARRARM